MFVMRFTERPYVAYTEDEVRGSFRSSSPAARRRGSGWRTRRRTWHRAAERSASAAASRDSIASACPSKNRPASVSSTVRRPRDRSITRCPTRASSAATWSLTVDSDVWSDSAAAQNVRR